MITALAAQNLAVMKQIRAGQKDTAPTGAPTGTTNSASESARNASPSQLTKSIMADGGLEFLRARIEEHMRQTFTPESEEPAANGPATRYDTPVDVSPAATADRIVSFALSLRSVYARQNSGLDEADLNARFESEIRRGIETGFGKARGILGNLNLLQKDTVEGLDATWAAVQEKLDNAFQKGLPVGEP